VFFEFVELVVGNRRTFLLCGGTDPGGEVCLKMLCLSFLKKAK